MTAGFLLKYTGSLPLSLFTLGWNVLATAVCVLAVRFSAAKKAAEQVRYDEAVAQRMGSMGVGGIQAAA